MLDLLYSPDFWTVLVLVLVLVVAPGIKLYRTWREVRRNPGAQVVIDEPSPLDYLAMGFTWLYRKGAGITEGDRAPAMMSAPDDNAAPAHVEVAGDVAPVLPATWLRWADEVPHLLIAAKTGGGKSTTVRKVLEPRIAAGEAVFIIDPHSSAWFDLPSVGGGENWQEVRAALDAVHGEYKRRLDERATYNRRTGRELAPEHFPRLTVVLDEGNITRGNLDNAKRGEVSPWARFAEVLGSGARKVRISVIILAQSALVDDLGISGAMRENFTRIALDTATIHAMIASDEKDPQRRKALYAALIDRQFPATLERNGRVYLLDRTGINRNSITSAARCAWSAGYDAVTGGVTDNDGNNEPFTASGSGEMDVTNAVTNDLKPAEIARIASLLTKMSASDAAKKLPGYTPNRYTEYKARVEAVRQLLED